MRRRRSDYAGADWHIWNRGIGKRAVFETARDVERFCDALGEVVDAGLLVVHAFVFMTTHYHLLVTSPKGEVSEAMKLVGNAFVRWWNRTRKRGGPLFERRFDGAKIKDAVYWERVVRYIDLNPVRARMCELPSDHPFGSARTYRHGRGPEWLERSRVEAALADFVSPRPYDCRDYDRFACSIDPAINAHLVERRMRAPHEPEPPLGDLIRTASLRQQSWMEWKARLADGIAVGTAFLPPSEALRAAGAAARLWERSEQPRPRMAAAIQCELRAGLLRGAAGLTIQEIADTLRISYGGAHAALRRHAERIRSSSRYDDVVARALQGAVRRALGPRASPLSMLPVVGDGEGRRVVVR